MSQQAVASVDIPNCSKLETFPFSAFDGLIAYNEQDPVLLDFFGKPNRDLLEDDIRAISSAFKECSSAKEGEWFSNYNRDYFPEFIDELMERIAVEGQDQNMRSASSESVERLYEELRSLGEGLPSAGQTLQSGTTYKQLTADELKRVDEIVAEAEEADQTEHDDFELSVRIEADRIRFVNEMATEQNRINAAQEASRPAPSEPSGPDPSVLVVHYTSFMIARYCAENDAAFTMDEVEKIQAEVRRFSQAFPLPQERKDQIWQALSGNFATMSPQITYESCAADKRQMAYTLPSVFAGGSGEANPF